MLEHFPLKRLPGTRKPFDTVVKTVCQECTVCCGLLVHVKENAIVDIHGDEDHPVSKGRLCAKGIAFAQALNHPDRIGQVLHRKKLDDPLGPADDFDKTLDAVAEQLRKIRSKYGPSSLMIGCDPDAGLDFYLGAMRFARLWGTPHVIHPLYSPNGLSTLPVTSASVPRCSDWVHSRCILLIEADLATTHPVAFNWLLDAKEHGARVIALDSRFTTSLSKADLGALINPESGNKLGLAIMKVLIEENLHDQACSEQVFKDYGGWKASYEALSIEAIEAATGLSTEKIREIARIMAAAKPVTVITGKRLAHPQDSGVWHTMSRSAGWDQMQGGGWYPLDAGLPPFLPYAGIPEDDTAKAGGPSAGSQNLECSINTFICSGNCLTEFMSSMHTAARCSELTLYFGAFPNETEQLAHVVIPATFWAEKEGLAFSNDRAIHWGNKISEPLQGCRSGLDLWTGLAHRLAEMRQLEGKTCFPWKNEDGMADQRSFYDWLLDQSPCTSGFTLDQITADGAAPTFWHAQPISQAPGKTEQIEPFAAPKTLEPSRNLPNTDCYPLTFQTTRIISRSGNTGAFLPWINNLEDLDMVQIHPETAGALGIENGDDVLIQGPGGAMEARASVTRMVPKRMVWSARKLEGACAVVHKRDQLADEAAQILREFLK